MVNVLTRHFPLVDGIPHMEQIIQQQKKIENWGHSQGIKCELTALICKASFCFICALEDKNQALLFKLYC